MSKRMLIIEVVLTARVEVPLPAGMPTRGEEFEEWARGQGSILTSPLYDTKLPGGSLSWTGTYVSDRRTGRALLEEA